MLLKVAPALHFGISQKCFSPHRDNVGCVCAGGGGWGVVNHLLIGGLLTKRLHGSKVCAGWCTCESVRRVLNVCARSSVFTCGTMTASFPNVCGDLDGLLLLFQG